MIKFTEKQQELLKQQKLFDEPKPMHICVKQGHKYEAAAEGYYKTKRIISEEPEADNRDFSKVFRVFICIWCASSVEICVKDRTPTNSPSLPLKAVKKTKRK